MTSETQLSWLTSGFCSQASAAEKSQVNWFRMLWCAIKVHSSSKELEDGDIRVSADLEIGRRSAIQLTQQ